MYSDPSGYNSLTELMTAVGIEGILLRASFFGLIAASFSAVVACIDTCESSEYSSEYVLKTAASQFVDTALWSVIGEVILGKALSKPLNAIGKKVVQTRLGGKALELAKSLGSATNKALDRAEQKLMEKTGGSWTKKVAQSKLGLGVKRVLADDTGSVEIGFGGSEGRSGSGEYYNTDGSPICPPNRGFDDHPTTTVIEPGTLVDRYGYDDGTFVSPKGISFTERALPMGTDKKPYTVFEVVKPIEVQAGKIAPWFGEKGGGIQYEFNQKISELLEQGVLRKVAN